MPSQKRELIVLKQPDFFQEAQFLMHAYFHHVNDPETAQMPWPRQPLVSRADRFTLSPEDMVAAFQDQWQYLVHCRRDAQAVLENQDSLRTLYLVRCAAGEDVESQSFPEGLTGYLPGASARTLSQADFLQACMLWILEASGESTDLEQLEQFGLGTEDLDMGAVFDAISRIPVSDTQRMDLLRFFQRIDAWHARLTALWAALEDICRRHYPLVEERFQRKVQALRAAGYQAEPMKWLERLKADIAGFRPGDPLELCISLQFYNGLTLRFPEDPGMSMRIVFGILFEELEALLHRQRARDELTDRQLKALADPTRLAIVRNLHQGERYVQQLADGLALTPATLSHHLNILLQALLVGVRAEGRRSYYSLNRGEIGQLSDDLGRLARPGQEGP